MTFPSSLIWLSELDKQRSWWSVARTKTSTTKWSPKIPMSLSKRLNSLRERLTLQIPSWLINLRVMVKGFQPAMSNSNRKTSRKNLRWFHHLKPQLSRCLKRRTLLRRRMSLDQNRSTLWPFRKLIRTTVVTYFSPLSKFLSLWGSRSNSTLWSR